MHAYAVIFILYLYLAIHTGSTYILPCMLPVSLYYLHFSSYLFLLRADQHRRSDNHAFLWSGVFSKYFMIIIILYHYGYNHNYYNF